MFGEGFTGCIRIETKHVSLSFRYISGKGKGEGSEIDFFPFPFSLSFSLATYTCVLVGSKCHTFRRIVYVFRSVSARCSLVLLDKISLGVFFSRRFLLFVSFPFFSFLRTVHGPNLRFTDRYQDIQIQIDISMSSHTEERL